MLEKEIPETCPSKKIYILLKKHFCKHFTSILKIFSPTLKDQEPLGLSNTKDVDNKEFGEALIDLCNDNTLQIAEDKLLEFLPEYCKILFPVFLLNYLKIQM